VFRKLIFRNKNVTRKRINYQDTQVHHRIKFKLGGDLVFLVNILGVNNATSNQPCPWCMIDVRNPIDVNDN
jgi:hypothetical protein